MLKRLRYNISALSTFFILMRRIVVFALFLCMCWIPAIGQWQWTLYGGEAAPLLASGNAPELRTSLATGLRASYRLADDQTGWMLTGEIWQMRPFSYNPPDTNAFPPDTFFHVKRYQLIPFMLGIGRRFALTSWATGMLHAAAGGYFRYIDCQQMSPARIIEEMGESGWGFSLRTAAGVSLWERLNLEVWFTAMGKPFEKEAGSLPGSESKRVVFNRTHWHLEGYRQCFWGFALGYSF